MAMSKTDVLSAVAEQAGCTKADAEAAIDAFFATVVSEVNAGNDVSWPKVGKFSLGERGARTGRNPQTGEEIQIAASRSMKFKQSAAVKADLN